MLWDLGCHTGMEEYSGLFSTKLQIVFSIAFFTYGRINCDIIQMKLQILHYRLHFHFRERTVTATFQMKKQSPFATVFPMSYEL